MSTLEKKFNREYNAWRSHCRINSVHSSPSKYIECAPFRNIVAMGTAALPFIRDSYAKEQGLPEEPYIHWPLAIHQIVPDFHLPVQDKVSGGAVERRLGSFVALDVSKVQQETLSWLDNYLARHSESKA